MYKVEDKELYNIAFKGLSAGKHVFDWTVDKRFFAMYELSEINDAVINVQLTMVKHADFLELHFVMDGWAEVDCDRCLDPLKLDVTAETQMFVKFGNCAGEDDSEGTDVIILPYSEDRLNVAQYLYEFAHLNLPIRKVHADNENGQSQCNADMISILEQFLVKS